MNHHEEREDFIRDFNSEVKKHDEEVFKLNKKQIQEWHEASLILPENFPNSPKLSLRKPPLG